MISNSQHVALLVRLHGQASGRQVFIQRIGVERLHVAGRLDQPARASANGARLMPDPGQLDPVHGQAQAPGKVAEQAEAVAADSTMNSRGR